MSYTRCPTIWTIGNTFVIFPFTRDFQRFSFEEASGLAEFADNVKLLEIV